MSGDDSRILPGLDPDMLRRVLTIEVESQIVRYGRTLEVGFTAARSTAKAHWSSQGSVLAGAISSTCHGVETHVEIDSDGDLARVAALPRNATPKGGCCGHAALQQSVAVVGTAVSLIGEAIRYEDQPRRVERRR